MHTQIISVVDKLRQSASVRNIIIGNIHSKSGVDLYKKYSECAFKLMFRVGIAGGSACSTSDATGVNRGQITEIMECSAETRKYPNFYTIADGGIKNGNYAAKAFGAGADFIMLGGFFARAKEAETNIVGDGTFWGGASLKQQERYGGKRRHSEGKVYKIEEELESLHDLIHGDGGIWGGLSSTVSYSGYNTLTDFIGQGVFEIKENSLPPVNRK
jgi:GMP reductase